MPRFLFYSAEGLTYTPYIQNEWDESEGGKEIENCQVIGWAEGDTPQEAFDRLLFDNSYLIETTFDEVVAVELKEEEHKTFSFFLESIREQQEAQ